MEPLEVTEEEMTLSTSLGIAEEGKEISMSLGSNYL